MEAFHALTATYRSVFNYPGMLDFFPVVEFGSTVFDMSLLFRVRLIGRLPVRDTLAPDLGNVWYVFESWLPSGAQFLLNRLKLTHQEG